MKKLLLLWAFMLSATGMSAKTLIVYYSFTNNVHTIATELQEQTGADVLRIEPAEEGLDYAADGYAIGGALIQAIRENPDAADSYPAIKPVSVDLSDYSMIIIGAPLWWSNMAAPLQTFLFQYGSQMAGKDIGLVVSSASSGISGVEADAKRLVPNGNFLAPSLWIRSSQTSGCRALITGWLEAIGYDDQSSVMTLGNEDEDVEFVASQHLSVKGVFDRFFLYSLSGMKVLETTESDIDTSGLVPGVYVGKAVRNRQVLSRKIYIRV